MAESSVGLMGVLADSALAAAVLFNQAADQGSLGHGNSPGELVL